MLTAFSDVWEELHSQLSCLTALLRFWGFCMQLYTVFKVISPTLDTFLCQQRARLIAYILVPNLTKDSISVGYIPATCKICVSVTTTRCQYQWVGRWVRSSRKQVWTSIQWWPSDVSSRMAGYPMKGRVSSPMSVGVGDISNYLDTLLPPPPPQWTETCLWKRYLSQTSYAGGKHTC